MIWTATERLPSLLATIALAFVLAEPAGAAHADATDVTSVPVAFQVTDTNGSAVPCFSDGATYTIRGHLTGPQSAFASGQAPAVTMYLFGEDAGEWNWHLTSIPEYDYATEMAKLGLVSLTVDELGYGASGHPPDGNLTCQGAEADISHQIIQQLRRGDYTLGTGPGISFSRVVLVGHDVGGAVAEIEAYSYSDIDALVLVTYADQGFTPWIIERETVAANDWCTLSPAQTPPGSPTSYVHFVSSQEYRTLLFYDADPRVIDTTDALRNPNPCGNIRSQPTAVFVDTARVSQITVPVLIVFGNNDDTVVWTRQGEEQQQGDFSGSQDKTTVFIPNAAHFPMFERTAPDFRAVVASWLQRTVPTWTGRGPSSG